DGKGRHTAVRFYENGAPIESVREIIAAVRAPTTFRATWRRESRHAAGVSAHSLHCLTNMVAKESRTAKY
ncbi:MAG TPA: hypothetical protein VMF50_15990, partial [Candidatus Binataceae bacterium]|nr:hypothetical protein [Candidatus Binataceae bacterium]